MKLEEIEAMLGKITPLPWLDTQVVNVNGVCGLSEYRINNPEIEVDIARCGNDYTFSKADSVFIAAAPTIIKDLLARNEELQWRVNHLESALGGIKEEAAAFASDERDLGYIFIGIYTTATNAIDAKEQDDD